MSTNPMNAICKHCKGLIKIRNPKGYCDHLYYPESCKTCNENYPEVDRERDLFRSMLYDLVQASKQAMIAMGQVQGNIEETSQLVDAQTILGKAIARTEGKKGP